MPRKTRHGATQPEESRKRKQVLLRMTPETLERLDAFAKANELVRSHVVEAAVTMILDAYARGEQALNVAADLPDAITDILDRDGAP